jgi:hypothetical protein
MTRRPASLENTGIFRALSRTTEGFWLLIVLVTVQMIAPVKYQNQRSHSFFERDRTYEVEVVGGRS